MGAELGSCGRGLVVLAAAVLLAVDVLLVMIWPVTSGLVREVLVALVVILFVLPFRRAQYLELWLFLLSLSRRLLEPCSHRHRIVIVWTVSIVY